MARYSATHPVEVSFRHMDVPTTERTRAYAQKKLGRTVAALPNLLSAHALISFEPTGRSENRYLVQLSLTADKSVLRAETHGPDMLSAIDRVNDLIGRRIRDWKGRVYYRRRRQGAAHKESLVVKAAEEGIGDGAEPTG